MDRVLEFFWTLKTNLILFNHLKITDFKLDLMYPMRTLQFHHYFGEIAKKMGLKMPLDCAGSKRKGEKKFSFCILEEDEELWGEWGPSSSTRALGT